MSSRSWMSVSIRWARKSPTKGVWYYSRNYREYIAGLKQWVCSATLVEAARAATT